MCKCYYTVGLKCPYETFSLSEILVCVGMTTSSYMGTGSPDVEVGDDFPLFFLCTSNPVSTPHVYTTTKATSRDMVTPIMAGVLIVSLDVSIVANTIIISHHDIIL